MQEILNIAKNDGKKIENINKLLEKAFPVVGGEEEVKNPEQE